MTKTRINLLYKERLIIVQEEDCFKCKQGDCATSNKVSQRISTKRTKY